VTMRDHGDLLKNGMSSESSPRSKVLYHPKEIYTGLLPDSKMESESRFLSRDVQALLTKRVPASDILTFRSPQALEPDPSVSQTPEVGSP
jgi:hypothetical protein